MDAKPTKHTQTLTLRKILCDSANAKPYKHTQPSPYYTFGDNKFEQQSKAYWDKIKGKKKKNPTALLAVGFQL